MGSELRLCIGHAHFKDEDDVGYSEYGWYSENLIVKLVPYLNQEQIFNLQSFIEEWTPYPINTESEHPSDRLRWFRRNEEERLKLLSCLPTTHFNARRLRQVREFKKNQKARIGKPNSIGMSTPVSSPMSSDAMNKASDEQLLKMLNTVNDIVDNRSSMTRFLGGGQSQLNSAFGRFSKDNPQRAIALIRESFEVGKNEKAAGEAISQLSESESVNTLEIKDLIFELDARGFTNESFRQDASRALNNLLRKRALTLNEHELNVIRSWLNQDVESLHNQYVDSQDLRVRNRNQNKRPEDKPAAKLFHNGRGIRFVKQNNYSYLTTLMLTYLCKNTPDYESWIIELEYHLEQNEDPSIWAYLLVSDSKYFVNVTSQRVKNLLSNIFNKFPKVLLDEDIVTVIWNLRDYLDDELINSVLLGWLTSNDELLLQVCGELTCALGVTRGEPYIGHTLSRVNDGNYFTVCGILFTATIAWQENDPTIRQRAHSLLLTLSEKISQRHAFIFVKSRVSSSPMRPDKLTIEYIQTIKNDPKLLRESSGYWAMKSLESLMLYPNAELTVLEFIESYIDLLFKSDLQNSRRNTENLVNILISLQRSSKGIQKRAMSAYEKLLSIRDFEAEKAIESSMRV
ncbi:hypothetical protein JQC92_19910 [Shewanella sp. 202IG2-18]|uniref:hypothetical protein n=1 Tax=Parashewanella hymeniacidonis TaxID=2807618 RepID=UPI001961C4C3|nr:hypothetical protein [Parashewanella hymeniacidonis]MBM7074264.1 hypothetical protein [Parashewanella hymeniacidonis]